LDPIGINGSEIGWILFQSRRYDEAIRELRSELAVHPDDAMAPWFLGFALIGSGQNEEAISVLKKTLALSDSAAVQGVLVTACARAGRRPEALRLI
jgi:predicted Zn-dependent protease